MSNIEGLKPKENSVFLVPRWFISVHGLNANQAMALEQAVKEIAPEANLTLFNSGGN